MNPDLTVIRRQGRYSVFAHSQPACLKDGTALDIHLVQQEGRPLDDRFLRAVLDHDLIQSHVFDVRDLASCLDAEIRTAHDRDAGDLVVLTLRQFYPDAASLLTKIVEESLAKLPPPEQPPQRQFEFEATACSAIAPADAVAVASFVRRNGVTERQLRNAKGGAHAAA